MSDEPKKKGELVMVPVRVIMVKKNSALIEWADNGVTKRGFIPANKVADELPHSLLQAAKPYGLQWEEILSPHISAKDLAKELYNAGVFTHEDTLHKDKVLGALQKALGIDLAAIRQAAYDATYGANKKGE